MPAWANIFFPQGIGREREPNEPFSVTGVLPAARISGTRSRDRFMRLLMVLAVPTLTCTITACGRPFMRYAPCAMATARFSCGTRIGLGTLALVFLARLNASTIGGKSVPGL